MKKQVYYIALYMVLALCHGCITEVDDVFDKRASERINESLTECKELLLSAPNGWLIEYYPASEQEYGGFNFIAAFNDKGDVTVEAEIAPPDYRVTSHYSLIMSNSVVLTLDTYNEIFHFLSDPDVGKGSSFKGDFEFTYVRGNKQEMTFKGTKTGNTIRFTALEENVNWGEYFKQAGKIKERISASPYCRFVWNGSDTPFVLDLNDNLPVFTYIPDSSKPYATESVAFCYTPTGISLYEPVQIGDVLVKTFTWDETTERFMSKDAKTVSGGDATIALDATTSDTYVPYETFLGDWIFSYDNKKESRPVTIKENVHNKSFKMTGLSTYEVVLGYSKRTGNLSMTTQYLGRYIDYYVHLCPWDCDAERLTWQDNSGFDLTYNGDAANPVLTISNNGVWGGDNVTGILFFAFKSPEPSGTAGYINKYPYVVDLHK